MSVRIQWKMFPNKNIAHMNVDMRLWDSIYADVFRVDITDKQKELLKALRDSHGVVDVSTGLYSIRIEKGTVFSWAEIRQTVESVFSGWAGCELISHLPCSPENH